MVPAGRSDLDEPDPRLRRAPGQQALPAEVIRFLPADAVQVERLL
jgi:hypothetical protein